MDMVLAECAIIADLTICYTRTPTCAPRRLMVVSQDSMRNSQGGKGRTLGVFVQCVPDSPGSPLVSKKPPPYTHTLPYKYPSNNHLTLPQITTLHTPLK